ncbi:cytochrome c biogenesis protein CcsA [Flavilitoribacter nigricans]|uniref:Cytochrome c assembly protein n=1 Tax=Flavilitoribacter nigricans (strain ATCC 23147 / DSM 23189 / NBRC 102662 / NCIMB 1420 / SS-2) TaxID=1122177 RepID=A0A2D0NDC9_FLAN2|nr:cytochrome c biogenesis protein CcsA [Flavilitoribacter nigricans]PHN06376.1 cytochrome c assembly protein [Flavilitoribacter nigricans DSM 23189 = NBRC 102662]
MDTIQYVGEHLWPGRLGHFAIILSFVAALLASLAYFYGTQRRGLPEASRWKNIGRAAFGVHGISVFAIIGLIFYVMINRYYEYQYAQSHVSDDLPFRYIFSAFWEGQEGSFLLWMFWHVVLGVVLILTSRKWESPVLSVLSLVQVFLMSMILGVYVGFGDEAARIGSNPMMLLRDVMDAPIFASADYTELISGTGLNPLLQNYWMTIHPPTLFLGFASTVVPFCFAIAGLWTKDHRAWLKPAMHWSLFSAAILGLGILMGAAWAYEALTFGGYWAWDPVENMSLVPWLVMVAGIHTNLIARSTGYSIRSTYAFYLLSFVLVLYSSFMTRSGVLGETSAHAFTEMGLEWQLVALNVAFLGLGAVLLAMRYKSIPSPKKEESTPSKEFWIFIGTLVLLFSALLITGSTSLPVFNKIYRFFDPSFKGFTVTDQLEHHNKYQLWIGVFIGILSGLAQYLRFKEFNWAKYKNKYWKHLGIGLAAAVGITALTALWVEARAWQYLLLLFAGVFAVVTNVDYIITFLKGNLKAAGSAFSHIGFGLLIVGVLASGLNKQYISSNPYVMTGLIEGAEQDAHKRNIILFKDIPMSMSGYKVEYTKDTIDGFTRTYTVNFQKMDESGAVKESFQVQPNVLYNNEFTKIAAVNPSTRRYWNKDIFTHITSLPESEMDVEARKAIEDNLKYQSADLTPGQVYQFQDTVAVEDQDTFSIRYFNLLVDGIDRNPSHPDYHPEEGDMAIGARLQIQQRGDDTVYTALPVIVLRDQLLYTYPVQINDLSTKVRLSESILDDLLIPEESLDYQEFTLKQGEVAQFGDYRITFAQFNRQPSHPNYEPQSEDIAVGATVQIQDAAGSNYIAQPIYLIRGNRPFNVKDQIPEIGFHVRFASIDPGTESISLLVAQNQNATNTVPVEMATNSVRSDFLVLQAIEFPGINLVWFGSLLMLAGMGVSLWNRRKESRNTEPDAA